MNEAEKRVFIYLLAPNILHKFCCCQATCVTSTFTFNWLPGGQTFRRPSFVNCHGHPRLFYNVLTCVVIRRPERCQQTCIEYWNQPSNKHEIYTQSHCCSHWRKVSVPVKLKLTTSLSWLSYPWQSTVSNGACKSISSAFVQTARRMYSNSKIIKQLVGFEKVDSNSR